MGSDRDTGHDPLRIAIQLEFGQSRGVSRPIVRREAGQLACPAPPAARVATTRPDTPRPCAGSPREFPWTG
jgi:hypothetical protein